MMIRTILFVVLQLCKLRGYGYVRLDGSMTPKQRQKVVEEFNKPDVSFS